MRAHLVLIASGLILSGCVSTTHQAPNDFVPLAYGSIDSFAALVPDSDGAPRCEAPSDAPVQPGGRALALVYAGPVEQQVTVTVDADGNPTKYLDVRGELSVDDGGGDRTTIALFLTEGYALLSNRPANGEPLMLEVPLAEALSSDRLGDPTARLQNVLSVCAGA